MNPSPELNTILKQLRLSGVLDSVEQRNRQAIDGQLAYTEFLAMLLHPGGRSNSPGYGHFKLPHLTTVD